MFFLTKEEKAVRAHLKHNIPAGHWCSNSHNGVTAVMHYRTLLLHSYNEIRGLRPSHPRRFFSIDTDWFFKAKGETPWNGTMHFTDRPEALGGSLRVAPGVVGSLREFERFCDQFTVIRGLPLYVPKADDLPMHYVSLKLGDLSNSNDFQQIFFLAERAMKESERQFG